MRVMQDCLKRGEAPFVSHLLYTQSPHIGFVANNDPNHQCLGRDAACTFFLKRYMLKIWVM